MENIYQRSLDLQQCVRKTFACYNNIWSPDWQVNSEIWCKDMMHMSQMHSFTNILEYPPYIQYWNITLDVIVHAGVNWKSDVCDTFLVKINKHSTPPKQGRVDHNYGMTGYIGATWDRPQLNQPTYETLVTTAFHTLVLTNSFWMRLHSK